MSIQIANQAPDFVANSIDNNTIALSDFKGRWIVLYFYPKDNTSGCTSEACSFRDNMQELTKFSTVVIGVSPDSIESHLKFKTKYDLNFNLISDTEHKISELYECWKEKSMYGKKYMGIERSTFIIDDKSIIRAIFRKVKVNGHIEEIINFLKNNINSK